MAYEDYALAIGALALVVALIFVLSWFMRRAGVVSGRMLGRSGRRLRVVEMTPVDVKRKLVLVRRDETEHLILLGIERDQVIETGIPAPVPSVRQDPPSLTDKPEPPGAETDKPAP